jgi:hypothetical protein
MASKNATPIVSVSPPVKDVSSVLGALATTSARDLVALQDKLTVTATVAAGTPRAELEQIFGRPRSWTGQATAPFADTNVPLSTNWPAMNQMACPFLATALTLAVRSTQECFSITGQSVPSNTVFSSSGVPALGAAARNGDGNISAIFSRGFYTQNAKMDLMNFLALQLIVGCNFEMMNQNFNDIGECSACGPVGMGSALYDPGPYIRAANKVRAAAGGTRQFLPQNVIPGCTPCDGYSPLPPALASVMVRNEGFEGGNGGLFAFPKNFVLCQGVSLGINTYRSEQDQFHYESFIENMSHVESQSLSDVLGANIQGQSVVLVAVQDMVFTSAPCGSSSTTPVAAGAVIPADLVGIGYSATGTLQIFPKYGPASTATQTFAVDTIIPASFYTATTTTSIIASSNYAVYKSGELEIEIAICGWNLTMRAALAWFTEQGCLTPAYSDMYANSTNALSAAANRAGFKDGLAGIDASTLEQARARIEQYREDRS